MTTEPKLIWLLAMHRHGDRAPLNMGKKDRYNDISYWPDGFGNLNNAGRLRMYKLGQFIRRKYSKFLSDNFREAYSRSSDVDRCIESSQALLAGLYPPTSKLDWNKHLAWCPAPVHTVPPPDDYILNEAGREVIQETIDEMIKLQNSEEVKKLYDDSVEERKLLEKEIAYEFDFFVKFKCVFSTFDIEESAGFEMPIWYTPELKEKLYYLAGKAFALAGGGTKRLKQLRSGRLLDDIIRRMELVVPASEVLAPNTRSDFHQPTNEPSSTDMRKFVHYSTHDSVLCALLEALDLNDEKPIPPGFGATFFIELYADLNIDSKDDPMEKKYLKLFYMDDTKFENPIEKHLPGCPLDEYGRLTLAAFKKHVESLLPETSN